MQTLYLGHGDVVVQVAEGEGKGLERQDHAPQYQAPMPVPTVLLPLVLHWRQHHSVASTCGRRAPALSYFSQLHTCKSLPQRMTGTLPAF